MSFGPVHPHLQLLHRVGGAGGVVGAAQVDDVALDVLAGHGQELVLRRGGHVADGAPRHHVVVHIHRVHRVGHQHGVVHIKQVQQVAQIALGAVRHKNFRDVQLYAVFGVVALNGLPQKLVALLAGDVAVKALLAALLVNGLVHRLGDRSRQRQCHVADAQTDDVPLRVGGLKFPHLAGDGAEQVAFVQFVVMLVQFHGGPPLSTSMQVSYHILRE